MGKKEREKEGQTTKGLAPPGNSKRMVGCKKPRRGGKSLGFPSQVPKKG